METATKFSYIDALRGIAILGVILVHTSELQQISEPDILKSAITNGARGVQLFYLASAFTLFLSFENRRNKENQPVRNFFIRRFFRIAPMYYVGIIYYLFQNGLGKRYWLGDESHISGLNIASNFTFLHGFNPYWINSLVPGGWSIAVEMTFYISLPFLYNKIRNFNQAFSFFLFTIFFRLILQYVFVKYPQIGFTRLWDEYLVLYFPSQLPVFALGILLFFAVHTSKEERILSGKSMLIFGMLLILHLLLGIGLIFPSHIVFSFCFFIIALALSKYEFALIVNPVINHIGKVSFSVYIVHFAVIYWLSRVNIPALFNSEVLNFGYYFFLVTGVAVLIATVTYTTIEVPFQKMGKRIINALEKGKKSKIDLLPV